MWDLEICCSSERLNQKLDILRQCFARLDLLARTRYFVVFGCTLPQPLSDQEKAILEGYIEQGVILRFRCGRQK